MNPTVEKLLNGSRDNHILPFFWLHGEEEAVLREYMEKIHGAGIGAVCLESRPHPDFCGPQWWHDVDVILDEAKKRNMQVWILDDSHFPTGFANGAVKTAPLSLRRQGICYRGVEWKDGAVIDVNEFLTASNRKGAGMFGMTVKDDPSLPADRLLSVTAIERERGRLLDLTGKVDDSGILRAALPEGSWTIGLCKLSYRCGAHPEYINMLDEASCRILLDAVYEPHYARYKGEFGKTIAGFFSDEPELGNGEMYTNALLGADQDVPWSDTLIPELANSLGAGWKNRLCYLWENGLDPSETARVRLAYMNAVTEQVAKAFSGQIGGWCREHGVEYIGHVIEDNNCHARMGGSLGHYFRGLSGQDMAGIDDIGGQVLPGGEDEPKMANAFSQRDGEFYHYILGKLGASLAAIDPKKKGRCMCEVFGAYGWAEGLRLEKYLCDHFLARGVNFFVPHAFSAKAFPDPDCPPHFYAGGHDPQFRHFGSLMSYLNRAATLLSGGRTVQKTALLYHAEGEWTGETMLMQKPARALFDRQIDFTILPFDVFTKPEEYRTDLSQGLSVNGSEYAVLVIPGLRCVTKRFVETVSKLAGKITVIFAGEKPRLVIDGDAAELKKLESCICLPVEKLPDYFEAHGWTDVLLSPANDRVRALHYENGGDLYFFVNEGKERYTGEITLPLPGPLCVYDAWENKLFALKQKAAGESSVTVKFSLEPSHSIFVLPGTASEAPLMEQPEYEIPLAKEWRRGMAEAIDYPGFSNEKSITLPDDPAKEYPDFSGIFRYEQTVKLPKGKNTLLTITDAYEGVEVFVNGRSAGVQVVPPFKFDISTLARPGENHIAIEVSSTLIRERMAAENREFMEKMNDPAEPDPTGLTGVVKLYRN